MEAVLRFVESQVSLQHPLVLLVGLAVVGYSLFVWFPQALAGAIGGAVIGMVLALVVLPLVGFGNAGGVLPLMAAIGAGMGLLVLR